MSVGKGKNSIRTRPLTTLLLLSAGLESGCSRLALMTALFPSESGGKSWQAAVYLEPDLQNPGRDSDGLTHRGFSGFISGTGDIWAVASFYDRSTSNFAGYGRRYMPGKGWAEAGTNFKRITTQAVAAGEAISEVTATSRGDGGALATFVVGATPGGSPEPGVLEPKYFESAEFSNGWKASTRSALLTAQDFLTFGNHLGRWGGPTLSSVFDDNGRGWIFGLQTAAPAAERVQAISWKPGAGFAGGNTLNATGWRALSLFGQRAPVSLNDGGGSILLISADQTADEGLFFVRIPAADLALSTDLSSTTPSSFTRSFSGQLLSPSGYAASADGAGTTWVIAYDDSSGAPRLYAQAIADGAWGSDVTDLSVGLPTGWVAASSSGDGYDFHETALGLDSHRLGNPIPAITHLGQGRFLAVFHAVNESEKINGLFYSTYTPGIEWSSPEPFGDFYSYSIRPNFQAITLFSNSVGGAGIAARIVTSESASTSLFSSRDESSLFVARFHLNTGWGSFTLAGGTCNPGDYDADSDGTKEAGDIGRKAGCTHKPAGFLLPSGEAVVLFQTQIGNLFRLAAISYR